MAGARIALIHSPLVGPGTWKPVAERLRLGGRHRRIEAPAACAWRAHSDAALAETIVGQLAPGAGEPWILVGHSAAGGLLPAIADAAGMTIEAAVFVDAVLPHPGQSWLQTAPPALQAEVLTGARDAEVAPWPQWFPPSVIERLLPDEAVRRGFVAECAPIPLAYLTAASPRPRVWPPRACAYLQLSEGYAAEAEAAARHWPVERLALHHLALLTDPDKVAAAIERVIDAIV